MNEPPSPASFAKGLTPTHANPMESGYGASSAPAQLGPADVEAGAPGTDETTDVSTQSRLDEHTADATTLQRQAAAATQAEVDKSLGIAWAITVPVGALLVLAVVRVLRDAPGERDSHWVSGHLALLFFLIAAQLVCALLVREHWRTIEEIVTAKRQSGAGRAGRWLAFVAVVIFVGLTLLSGRLPFETWSQVLAMGVIGETFAITVVLAARQRFEAHTKSLSDSAAPPAPLGPAGGGAETIPDPWAEPAELVAIGASGGGIRAAAFVLGGVNALQTAPRFRAQASEPEVFAVSGGSYTAAALALRRRFSEDVERNPDKVVGWRDAFTIDSPELDYLRRHTRYLFEPGSRLKDGAVSLLVGAVVNLFIVAAMLRGLAWLSAQLTVTSGIVTFSEGLPSLDVARLVITTTVTVAALIAGATVWQWSIHDKFDRGAATSDDDIAWMTRLSSVRTSALAGGAAVLLLIGIPFATLAIVDAVSHNRPTATVAALLKSSGFGTQAVCEAALEAQVVQAVDDAARRARLSPGAERSVDTGACGATVTVSQTVQTQGDDDFSNDVIPPVDTEQVRGLADRVSTPIQVGTILALLGSVVGLLARGPAADEAREGRWFARLKRKVVTWVPLVITASIGLYLLLLWHLHFLLGVGMAAFVLPNALMLVGAAVLAFFLDANQTSMHQFYRERLSSAFAVEVHSEETPAASQESADELPRERVYRFSELADGPRLNVVTTLNTQAAHEVPTLRGGKPLVFGGRHVDLHETRKGGTRVPTRDYEAFAGPGRTSIMATVAMSGAAISPLMGRYAGQMKPYRILLTLFNLRVGMWMLNPTHTMLIDDGPPGHRGRLAVTARPGPAQVALEAVGKSSARERWVYVSDGGHLDNTAMVECVRHALRRTPTGRQLRGQVVVLDASNDPPGAWSAVGDALNVIRADLGVDLVRKFTAGEPPWMRQFVELAPDGTHGKETFRVIVVKAVRVEPVADGGGTDWHRRLPEPVKSIQVLRPDFPRSSTARQRFGDLEFEAYRAYGFAAVSEALAFLDKPPRADRGIPSASLERRARGRLGS